MKTIKQTRLLASIIAAMGLVSGAAQAQCTFPLNGEPFDIKGFEVRQGPSGAKHFTFVPQCEGGDCPVEVLRAYNFIWDFGDGTYSFESVPVHIYASASSTGGFVASLKATNIYEEPDRIHEAGPGGVITCTVETEPVFVTHPANPKGARVELLAWNEVAKAGHELKYIASFQNKRNVPEAFIAEFRPGPGVRLRDENGNPVRLEPSRNVVTQVQVLNDGRGDFVRFSGVVPGHQQAQVLIHAMLKPLIGDSVVTAELSVQYHCDDQLADCRKEDNAQSALPIGEEWDPNLLISTPQSYIVPGEYVQYTVNFENMGTGRADSITIIDSLPLAADPSTFEIICTSHPTRFGGYTLKDNRLVIVFPNIRLPAQHPDEDPDEAVPNYMARNQGFVTYRVRLKEDIMVGEKVQNKVYIGFDKQPLISTNTIEITVPPDMHVLDKKRVGQK